MGSGNIRHERWPGAGAVCGRRLRAAESAATRRLVFLWNSDEEIGSQTSRGEIEREARQSDAVLVLEPAYGRDG